MDAFELCRSLLPSKLKEALLTHREAEELRLRCGRKPSIITGGKEKEISDVVLTENDILHVIELATGASLHSSAVSLARGFINYKGLRIGICGQAIYSNDKVLGFRKYFSLSIRIPHQLDVIPNEVTQGILCELSSTLVVAPPGVGKTTALRELVRICSDKGIRVSLVDERGELSGAGFEYKLGRCTDVMTDVPKAEAAIMLLRSMNPEIIAMDEISSAEDIAAVNEISGCGVAVFATAHGKNREDMLRRDVYRKMLSHGLFDKFLIISAKNGKREYTLERTDK